MAEKLNYLSVIRPLLLSLSPYGVGIQDSEKGSKQPGRCRLVGSGIYLTFVTFSCLAVTIYIWRNMPSNQEQLALFCFAVVAIAVNILTIFNAICIASKRKRLEDIILRLKKFGHIVAKHRPNALRKMNVLLYISLVIPYLIPWILFLVFMIITRGDENLMKGAVDGAALCMWGDADQNFQFYCVRVVFYTGIVFVFLWVTCVFACFIHCIAVIITTTYTIWLLFQTVEQEITEKEVTDKNHGWVFNYESHYAGKRAKQFIRQHKEICQLVRLANKIFKEINFALGALEMLMIIFILRGMDFKNHSSSVTKLAVPFVIFTVSFICRTTFGAMVNYQVLASLKAILKVEPTADFECPSSETVKAIDDYVKHMQLNPPSITGWGLFRLEDSCILTIAGYVLTYTLALYGIG